MLLIHLTNINHNVYNKLVSTSSWHPYQKIHRNIHFPPFFTPRHSVSFHHRSIFRNKHTCFVSTVGTYQGTNIKPEITSLSRTVTPNLPSYNGRGKVAAAYVKSYSMCANGICESKSAALLLSAKWRPTAGDIYQIYCSRNINKRRESRTGGGRHKL